MVRLNPEDLLLYNAANNFENILLALRYIILYITLDENLLIFNRS